MVPLVKSVYDDQDKLLASMVGLHSGGAVKCDVTYGRGRFYRYVLEPPRLKFDIAPRRPGVVAADVRNLPIEGDSVASVMFDPPFLDGGGKARRRAATMFQRYSAIDGGVRELVSLYREAMAEIRRVLIPGGILYFKCQDIVDGRRNTFVHVDVYNAALELRFRPRDLFILLAKNRPIQYNLYKQVHARKFHCYFWVFEKRKRNA